MTTTMMRMKEVVEQVRVQGVCCKVVIGGAAITESFAEKIGADGYSKDAADCVRLVERLLGKFLELLRMKKVRQKNIKKVLTIKKTSSILIKSVAVSSRQIRDLSSAGEHLPYKQRVIGSSPIGPILYKIWRNSSVGQSTRFIPVVSRVQISLPLLEIDLRTGSFLGLFSIWYTCTFSAHTNSKKRKSRSFYGIIVEKAGKEFSA